jgi:hypothetical protein
MNNYPDGVNENTPNAPWNEIEKTIDVVLECTMSISFSHPPTDEEVYESIDCFIEEEIKNKNYIIKEVIIK